MEPELDRSSLSFDHQNSQHEAADVVTTFDTIPDYICTNYLNQGEFQHSIIVNGLDKETMITIHDGHHQNKSCSSRSLLSQSNHQQSSAFLPKVFISENKSIMKLKMKKSKFPEQMDNCKKQFGYHKMIEDKKSNRDDSQSSIQIEPSDSNQKYFKEQVPYHCHNSSMETELQQQSRRAMMKLIYGMIICTLFMIIELIGGYLSHSLAIFTDAAHLLSDLISFTISLVAIYFGQKPATRTKSFGYFRVEVIGVLFSVFLTWFLTGILIYFAIKRMVTKDFELNSWTMLITSAIGLAMNLLMWLVLSGGGCFHQRHNNKEEEQEGQSSHYHQHHHNGGHSHMNMNVRAAILHIVGDTIQSIGVLVASLIIHFKPEWKSADPVCTFLFATLVFFTTYSIMKDTVHILMEGFPREYSYEAVERMLKEQIFGVRHVHSLHIWSLTHGRNALAVHLTVDFDDEENQQGYFFEKIRNQAQMLIHRELRISQTTIQIEHHHAELIKACQSCERPKK